MFVLTITVVLCSIPSVIRFISKLKSTSAPSLTGFVRAIRCVYTFEKIKIIIIKQTHT